MERRHSRSDPKNLDELKWMGIDAVTTANNHSFDFSEGGFLTTLDHCRQIDLPTAGGGYDIDQARSPAYVDSPRGPGGRHVGYQHFQRAVQGRPG